LNIIKHTIFLKDVFFYTITAFGGPQAHVALLLKKFVHKKKYLTEEELFEYYSFCQLLPGASSTQLIGLIGYKKGGIILSLFTLMIWILPAAFFMCLLSFLFSNNNLKLSADTFRFIHPMVIGFLIYSSIAAFSVSVKNTITKVIVVIASITTFLFIKTPWIFPVLIILGGTATNFSNKRIPEKENVRPRQIKWTNIWLFIFIFIAAGYFSETARKQNWVEKKQFNLFENFYRFGSFVFGGGDVLLPMMLDQYVEHPRSKQNTNNAVHLEKNELLSGFGVVRAIPGPVFSVASFVGGVAFKNQGKIKQITGSLIATVAIFLPSILLMLFFYPVWNYLKRFVVVYRSLEGINAVVVGLMIAAIIYLIKEINFTIFSINYFVDIIIIIITLLYLRFTSFPPPLLVAIIFILGFLF
jgi:chromate transporter